MAAGAVEVNITSMNAKGCNVFDGVDDYVEIPHNDNQLGANLSNGFTISAWINPRSFGAFSLGKILDKSASGNDGLNGLTFQLQTTTGIRWRTGGVSNNFNNCITLGNWQHFLIIVKSDSKISLYKNGVLEGSADTQGGLINTITTTNVMRIGNNSVDTLRTFDGGIAKVKMWNKVLDATERAKDYAGSLVAKDNLILNVPLHGDYSNGTNSGSIPQVVEDAVAAAIKADRVTANDKFFMVGVGGQIVSAVIEEAP